MRKDKCLRKISDLHRFHMEQMFCLAPKPLDHTADYHERAQAWHFSAATKHRTEDSSLQKKKEFRTSNIRMVFFIVPLFFWTTENEGNVFLWKMDSHLKNIHWWEIPETFWKGYWKDWIEMFYKTEMVRLTMASRLVLTPFYPLFQYFWRYSPGTQNTSIPWTLVINVEHGSYPRPADSGALEVAEPILQRIQMSLKFEDHWSTQLSDLAKICTCITSLLKVCLAIHYLEKNPEPFKWCIFFFRHRACTLTPLQLLEYATGHVSLESRILFSECLLLLDLSARKGLGAHIRTRLTR